MVYKPLRMDTIKQIIGYHKQGVSKKKISRLMGVSRNTVKKYIQQYTDQASNDENVSSQAVSGPTSISRIDKQKELIFNNQLSHWLSELGRVGVTRYLLWEEYRRTYPDGYSYSRFCRKLATYKSRQDVTLRVTHKAAYRLSIDYAGKKIAWVDKRTGEQHYAEVLICTMPYSSYTFAMAIASQKQEDFIIGINGALKYIGGLPQVLQSDNLKSYVKRADRYDPSFTDLCVQLSSYYGVELEATRVGKPKDKANVERHVRIVYQRIYAPLRDHTFHSVREINEAFIPLLDQLNSHPLQGKEHSRKDLFERDERPHLQELPSHLFEIKKTTRAKVQRNYHVILGEDKHQYSVPYEYVGKHTVVVYTHKTVEIYHAQHRIAIHKRDRRPHSYSTLPIHMPEKHLAYYEQKGWDATYFESQAKRIGPMTLWAIKSMLTSKSLIEQTYNACLGLLKLKNSYGHDRLENACAKAHTTHRVNYGIIKNILQNNMDQHNPDKSLKPFNTPKHDNVRGSQAYS